MKKNLQITLFAIVMACGMNLMGSAKNTSPLLNWYSPSGILSPTRHVLKQGLSLITASIYVSGSSFNQVGIKKIAILSVLDVAQNKIITSAEDSFLKHPNHTNYQQNKTALWIARSLIHGINSAITAYVINGSVDYKRFGKIFALHTVQHLI